MSNIFVRFVSGTFVAQYKATIGADFLYQNIAIADKQVSLQIWDTAGQEKYYSMQGVFYKGSDACLLVYDITNMDSFQGIYKWKEEFLNYANVQNPDNFPFILIGNKADLTEERKGRFVKISYRFL